MKKKSIPPTTYNPATEIPKKSKRYLPSKAKRISAKAAVNTAFIAVVLLCLLVRSLVIERYTGIVPIGFISVKKEVK
jgi:hypothetical protein